MIGLIAGDIIGSPYEFSNKAREGFDLFGSDRCTYTDDTVLTAAVCDAILQTKSILSDAELRRNVRICLQRYAIQFPFAGYGGGFLSWVERFDPFPYYSFGNGAGMRVSPVAYVGKTAEEVFALSDICTGVTHNHPEGLKGARAIALAVFLARHSEKTDEKKDKEKIRQSIQQRFYRLNFTIDEIKDTYVGNSTCMDTVPQAIEAFLEADGYENAVRKAVSLGGDSDTLAAMTGTIAEAYYGVPEEIRHKALTYLDERLTMVISEFEERFP